MEQEKEMRRIVRNKRQIELLELIGNGKFPRLSDLRDILYNASLVKHHGNLTEAAKQIGISRKTLQRWLYPSTEKKKENVNTDQGNVGIG